MVLGKDGKPLVDVVTGNIGALRTSQVIVQVKILDNRFIEQSIVHNINFAGFAVQVDNCARSRGVVIEKDSGRTSEGIVEVDVPASSPWEIQSESCTHVA